MHKLDPAELEYSENPTIMFFPEKKGVTGIEEK